MIPFATCMRFNQSKTKLNQLASASITIRQNVGDNRIGNVQFGQAKNAQLSCFQTLDEKNVLSFTWAQKDKCPKINVEAEINVMEDDKPKVDKVIHNLSTKGNRRKSSTSIRFADDADTGTDILMITEENLGDIISNTAGTLVPTSMDSIHSIRNLNFLSNAQELLEALDFRIDGAGALMISSHQTNQNLAQRRLLLTLRRRKSIQKSIHIDPIALLDYSYHGITQRFLCSVSNWSFNSFTLDTLTGGHSLFHLLLYLFKHYNFIEIFNLDIMNVWKCFRLFENGYHDTNPYHNSVHAADVTQAMHCFIEEDKISQYLTPLEKMCSLLAAVAHDLDHPGVNQHFLIATNSHLASLYNNLSVLESHHWRFAISCLKESQIFSHFTVKQWKKVQYLLSSLILATDISQQGIYLKKFQDSLSSKSCIDMTLASNRLFILQIALKCADLGNPCRPWMLSKRWTEQICNEFYRQGDYERQLNINVTPICDRRTASMARIQTDFFRNIVSPLFQLWDQFLCSKLSRKIIFNLHFNNSQWSKSLEKLNVKRRHSYESSKLLIKPSKQTSKSLNDLYSIEPFSNLDNLENSESNKFKIEEDEEKENCLNKKQCINGCGTPSLALSSIFSIDSNFKDYSSRKSKDDFTRSHLSDNLGCLTHSFSSFSNCPHTFTSYSYHSLFDTAEYMSGRRGSAPGCIGIYANCEIAAAAALVFLHGAVSSNQSVHQQKRRSSFPAEKPTNIKTNNQLLNGAKLPTKIKSGRSLELLMSSLTTNNSLLNSQHSCSLDFSTECNRWLFNNRERRGSAPQDIYITNYSLDDCM